MSLHLSKCRIVENNMLRVNYQIHVDCCLLSELLVTPTTQLFYHIKSILCYEEEGRHLFPVNEMDLIFNKFIIFSDSIEHF